MSSGTITPSGYQQEIDANGDPISGALIYTYEAGTSTPATTWTDADLNTENENPIEADSAGRWSAFLMPNSAYKFVYCLPVTPIPPPSSPPSAYWTEDGIEGVPQGNVGVLVTGTAGENLTAGNVVYLSDGSGSKNAGSWYVADSANAYSSTLPEIGIVPNDIASTEQGTIIIEGRATGLSALSPSTYTYYIGTAGALTSTAPTLARIVGVADSTTSLIVNGNPNATPPNADNGVNDFRLTLTTGVAVTVTDVLAATTLYCTPYNGNRIGLATSAGVVTVYTSAQFSIAVPGSTSQMYDIFCYNNSGVPTLELTAWTNDTTRATAVVLTTTGFYTKSGDLTRRLLGSFRTTTVNGQTEDSEKKRYLSNLYNDVPRPIRVVDSTDSWTYSTNTWRQARATATNQADVVVCIAGKQMSLMVAGTMTQDSTGGQQAVSVGENSTTTPMTTSINITGSVAVANIYTTSTSTLRNYPPVGRTFYVWLEYASIGGTGTFFGDNGGTAACQSGMIGTIQG